MPLQEGDIEVLSIATRTMKHANGKMGEAKEIRFRLRGESEEVIYIPLEEYSKAHAEQMLMRAAAEIIDLLDRFPIKG
jgi:hypothetical protein